MARFIAVSRNAADGPAVDEDGVTFVLTDRYRRLTAVRLVQDVGLSGGLGFTRDRARWTLRLPRPPVDRMEYLFEVEDDNGNRWTITDPGTVRQAPGAFGAKSVLEFPGYQPPGWLAAPIVEGTEVPFDVDAPLLDATVTGTVWTPAGLGEEPAPLLVVHDGPEFAGLGGFTRYLAASIATGAVPPLRAALLAPGDRNAWYSASPGYADTLVSAVLPALPAATVRVGVGVSLGALSILHAHRTRDGVFDALLLQSGSFFTPDLDPQESGFSGFRAVTGFVASLHAAGSDDHPVPTAITCGAAEENLANNALMAKTLRRLGYPTQVTIVRDTHNYTAWRDALHPRLTELIASLAAPRAA